MRRINVNCKPYEHKWVHQETTLSRIVPPAGEAIDKFPETRTATFKCLMLGARVNAILGKQAYNKIINVAEKDFNDLKTINFFLVALMDAIEEEGLEVLVR